MAQDRKGNEYFKQPGSSAQEKIQFVKCSSLNC